MEAILPVTRSREWPQCAIIYPFVRRGPGVYGQSDLGDEKALRLALARERAADPGPWNLEDRCDLNEETHYRVTPATAGANRASENVPEVQVPRTGGGGRPVWLV